MSTFGRYTLVRRVGTGGMAEIWKAKAQGPAGFEKVLAIKKVLPHLVEDGEFIQMFIEEAKLVATLVHPNIVQVFDFGQVGRLDYFIAMEYVPGGNLAVILKRIAERGARLPLEVSLYIVIEACKGLGYAHAKTDLAGRPLGIVHRDVSPQNILVSFSGEVKVTDFGIAKVESALTRTAEGHVRGKLAYMSPEQAQTRPLDNRSDLFSLGIVLFELLTGRRLFYGTSSSEIFAKVTSFVVPTDEDLGKLPFEVRQIAKQALQSEPDERYQDAMELEQALNNALGPEGIVQARHALASIVQRLFDEERKLEMTAELSTVPADPENAPTEAPVVHASTGAQLGVAPAMEPAAKPTTPSGLTLAPSRVQPVHGAQVLPAGPSAVPVRDDRARGIGGMLAIGVLFIAAMAAAAVLGSKYLPSAGVAGTPTPFGTPTVVVAETETPAPTPTPATPTPVRTPRTTPTRVAVIATPVSVPTAVPVAGKGFLTVNAKPWARVLLGTKQIDDETPLRRYELPAGKHTIVLMQGSVRREVQVNVPANKEVDLFVDMPSGQVKTGLK